MSGLCLLTGKFCENRVPYCKAGYNYCVNGATCVAMDADYRWVLTTFMVFPHYSEESKSKLSKQAANQCFD